MRILAIETSCDETAIALVEIKKDGNKTKFKILGNEISSQANLHAQYGGVFPALAKREHLINLPIIFEKVLKQARIQTPTPPLPLVRGREKERSSSNIETCPARSRESSQRVSTSSWIDAIAVTTGPGLEPALWTGITFAKELNKKYKIPIIPVNHMEGHIFSIFPKKNKTFTVDINKKIFPILSLLVSGGHTELVLIKDFPLNSTQGKMKYKKIGQTRDDAVGEAFDKVARMLGLPYPGGPEIGKLAEQERSRELSKFLGPRMRGTESVPDHKNLGNSLSQEPERESSVLGGLGSATARARGIFQQKNIRASQNTTSSEFTLPRPMINSKDYDFSFSGLKTAVLYLIRDLEKQYPNILQNDQIKQKIAKEFEDAAFEVIAHKTIRAIKEHNIKTLIVGGGVSASPQLKKVLTDEVKKNKLKIKTYFPGHGHTGDNALMIAISGYFQYQNKKNTKKIGSIKANGNLSL